MTFDGRDLTGPWMIDEEGHWQAPGERALNRARVAERGWVWIGPSDSPSAGPCAVRVCFRPSVVDAVAIERAIDWLEGLSRERPTELLLIEDGRELVPFASPEEAIDRCLAVCKAMAEIRILGFRNEPLEASEILALPELGNAWQRISRLRPSPSATEDAMRFASDDKLGLTCALTWIGDQVAYSHFGCEVAFRSELARSTWPGRPLRDLGAYDAAAAELFDDLLRFRKPLLHRLEVQLRRRINPPEAIAYNRLLMLYPTPADVRPVAISFMRPA